MAAMVAQVHGILLAAGESRRMGYPKPLLTINSLTFVAHISGTILEVVPRLVVVVGAYGDRVRAALPGDARIAVVENTDYRLGQLSSLRCGLAATGSECSAVLVHLCDHPLAKADTFRQVVRAWVETASPIVIARYRGRRGHPVLFARALFGELMNADDSRGAKAVVEADPSRVRYVEVDDPGIVADLDTPDDLARAGLGKPRGPGLH